MNERGVELPRFIKLLETTALFEGVTADQLIALSSVCWERRYAPNQLILREGAPDPFVYVIVDGRAQVTKKTSTGGDPMRMGEIGSGDVLGELKIVDPQPSSASIVAVTEVIAIAIDLDGFAQSGALAAIRATVVSNVGRILAERLRASTGRGADAMQRELDESRARAHAGRFIVLMFAMLALYGLAISALDLVPASGRPPVSILSFVLIIWMVIPILLSVRRSPFPLESYGLTTRRCGRVALQSLAWTTPWLLLLLALKLVLMRWAPSMADRPLFDPTALFAGRPFDLGFYLLAILLYLIHTPVQELVARAGLQGTLQNFIPTPPGHINWKAIVVSNLLYSSAHSYIGFWFCVATFVPGLFWGWMFAKQRSLVGVTVSHIAVGLWAIFALGVHAIIGGG